MTFVKVSRYGKNIICFCWNIYEPSIVSSPLVGEYEWVIYDQFSSLSRHQYDEINFQKLSPHVYI